MLEDEILIVPARRRGESLEEWYKRCILIYNLGIKNE